MGEKTKYEVIDTELAKRLKQLREDNSDNVSLIHKWCRTHYRNGFCGKYGQDESICDNCTRTYNALTQENLAEMFGLSKATIENCEQKGKISNKTRGKYITFFGRELFNKYVLGDNIPLNDTPALYDTFVKHGVSAPPCFLHRELELRQLLDKVKNNVVTVVCADGGVGKTTLVEQFLFEYSGEFDYYQTITVDFDSVESKSFELKRFLGALKLTVQGESELSDNIEAERTKWVGDRLCELKNGALFVLDNFACVGNEIRELERNFPNCRFIITTRKTKGIRPECVLHIGEFDNEKACELFEIYLQRQNNPLNEEERNVFNTQINSWCCGNAEAIYYVAKMLVSSISTVSEYSEIEKWLSFYSGLEKDLTGDSSLADKLSALLRLDTELVASLNDADKSHNSVLKLLAVLSITEMHEIPVKSLIEFLGEKKEFTVDIIRLEGKGLLKINNATQSVRMHPLICHALQLNGIQQMYSADVKVYSYLITNKESIATKYGVTEMTDIVIPNGISKIGKGAFSGFAADNAHVEEDSDIWSDDYKIHIGLKKLFSLRRLVIAKNVREIGAWAFDCGLEELYIEDGLEHIGRGAFSFSKIKKLAIPGSVKVIDGEAFHSCDNLKEVIFSEGLKRIGYHAFEGARLEKIEFPDSVECIAWGAFSCYASEFSSPQRVHFGKNLKKLQTSRAFNNANSLTISEENKTYYAKNNCIIRRKDNALVLGCATSVIPECVEKIDAHAFSRAENLPYNVKNGAKYLGSRDNKYYALIKAEKDAEVFEIDSACKLVADQAFSGCEKQSEEKDS